LSGKQDELKKIASTEIWDFFFWFEDNDELEADDITVTEVTITEVNEFQTQDREILVTGTAKVTAIIDYSGPDMSTAIYDYEDRRSYAFRTVAGQTEQEFDLDFTMTLSTDENGAIDQMENMRFVNTGALTVSFSDSYS
jgi:hypothetical protein